MSKSQHALPPPSIDDQMMAEIWEGIKELHAELDPNLLSSQLTITQRRTIVFNPDLTEEIRSWGSQPRGSRIDVALRSIPISRELCILSRKQVVDDGLQLRLRNGQFTFNTSWLFVPAWQGFSGVRVDCVLNKELREIKFELPVDVNFDIGALSMSESKIPTG